jgi:hypothetical protein
MQVLFSIFRTKVSRNRKSCKWCGNRCYTGITIRHANRSGVEVIRGFCCPSCADQIGYFAKQLEVSGETP